VVKCIEIKDMRKEFIKELLVALVKAKPEDISVDLIMSFLEDILRYLDNEEDKDYKMNQQFVGMKELFRGYVVIMWEGTNENSDKYRVMNKIVVNKCVNFYVQCWKKRNETYHDEGKQRERIKKWYENEINKAKSSEIRQLRDYAQKFKLNEERSSTEMMKVWIKNLKELEKKIGEVSKNDIRRYMSAREI